MSRDARIRRRPRRRACTRSGQRRAAGGNRDRDRLRGGRRTGDAGRAGERWGCAGRRGPGNRGRGRKGRCRARRAGGGGGRRGRKDPEQGNDIRGADHAIAVHIESGATVVAAEQCRRQRIEVRLIDTTVAVRVARKPVWLTGHVAGGCKRGRDAGVCEQGESQQRNEQPEAISHTSERPQAERQVSESMHQQLCGQTRASLTIACGGAVRAPERGSARLPSWRRCASPA